MTKIVNKKSTNTVKHMAKIANKNQHQLAQLNILQKS